MTDIEIREATADDVGSIVEYYHSSSDEHLLAMGVDREKLPSRAEWRAQIQNEIAKPYSKKQLYFLAWILNNQRVGHSSLNEISFGKEAHMHLHLWANQHRKQGLGTTLVRKSIKKYFEVFELERLYCEPYAHNPAPNRLISKLGFELVGTFRKEPGFINLEQDVNKWVLTRDILLSRVLDRG